MGKRFKDVVTLSKGARIQFEKAGPVSGLSFRGGSIAIGRNETYIGVEVMGSGLSSRTVVSRAALEGTAAPYAANRAKPECRAALAALRAHNASGSGIELRADVALTGSTVFRYIDSDGRIDDPILIQGIQQLPEIKAAMAILKHEQERVWDEVCMEMVDMSRELIDLYRLMPPVIPPHAFADAASDSTVFAHRVIADGEDRSAALAAFTAKGDEAIAQAVKHWISSITLPVQLSAAVRVEGGLLCLDLDLPKPSDLPSIAMKKLPGGVVKAVEKASEQQRSDYALCVVGLAFFVAANAMNLNENINRVLVSGFAPSRMPGTDADQCLYSILFPREQLQGVRIADPLRVVGDFTHRMKLSAGCDFAPVKPCDPRDFSTR